MRKRGQSSYFEPKILEGSRIRKLSRKAQESSQFNTLSTHEDEDYLSFYIANDIPINAQQALSVPDWKAAMEREMHSIYENSTWELVRDEG